MLSLLQARRKTAEAGEPILTPFRSLADAGIHIRKGQLTMVAAPPGLGKTLLTHAMLHHGDGKNRNSVFYFQADTPAATMFSRSAALATGYEQAEIERMVEAGAAETIEAKVKKSEAHFSWAFDTSIGLDRIRDHLSAYVEIHDSYPEVIVVDTLAKMVPPEDADEFRGLGDACADLVNLAKETGSAVIALHHVGGPYEGGDQAIPLAGIRGKVSKDASLILTLYRRSSDEIRVSVVKNRTGRAEASGGFSFGIRADMARMKFSG